MMLGAALLHPITDYMGGNDRGRLLCKVIALLIGLPPLIVVASAAFRRATRKNSSLLPLWSVGALAAGLLFAGILCAVRWWSLDIDLLKAQFRPWRNVDAFRIGFMMGLMNFGLWALIFVLPFAVEDARIRALEAEKLRAMTELAQLRSYLEPHFLLNTLSAIAGLVTEDPRTARRLIAALGDLLRDARSGEDEMQPLDEQIEWLRRYADILEVRHSGYLAFQWQVDGTTHPALLPRLLLQPLLENAVKHGALMRAGGGIITVRTEIESGKLVCTIEDNGPGLPEGEPRAGAFGLDSVRRRLAFRYANEATLRLESSARGTRSVVELPLRPVASP